MPQKLSPLSFSLTMGHATTRSSRKGFGQWQKRGKTYHAILGVKSYSPLQIKFWRRSKIGLAWSVPISSEGNDRARTKGGGYHEEVGGGVYTRETGTIWQIGVLAAERSLFLGQKCMILGRFELRFSEKVWSTFVRTMVGFSKRSAK